MSEDIRRTILERRAGFIVAATAIGVGVVLTACTDPEVCLEAPDPPDSGLVDTGSDAATG